MVWFGMAWHGMVWSGLDGSLLSVLVVEASVYIYGYDTS